MSGEHVLKSSLPPPRPEDIPVIKPAKDVSSTEINKLVQKDEIKSEPYGVSYFGVKGWGELLLDPQIDVHEIKNKIVFIEGFLSEKLSKSNMKLDKESFNSILSDIEKELRLDDNFEPHFRVKRVSQYLESVKKSQIEESERKARLKKILK